MSLATLKKLYTGASFFTLNVGKLVAYYPVKVTFYPKLQTLPRFVAKTSPAAPIFDLQEDNFIIFIIRGGGELKPPSSDTPGPICRGETSGHTFGALLPLHLVFVSYLHYLYTSSQVFLENPVGSLLFVWLFYCIQIPRGYFCSRTTINNGNGCNVTTNGSK